MKVKRLQLIDRVSFMNVEIGITPWQLADYIPIKDGNKVIMVHKDKIIGFEVANENSRLDNNGKSGDL